jgi:hypothetical protein
MTLATKQKRFIIIFMLINLFALFVNFFQLSPVYRYYSEEYSTKHLVYFFTDAEYHHYNHLIDKEFWPFVEFYTEDTSSAYIGSVFRGIFPDFDFSEFAVYTFIIFGFIFIKKIW